MAIEFRKVSYVFKGVRKEFDETAIEDIDLRIEEKGEFIAICGQTGSGKSTLINHMNALLTPTSGEIQIFDRVIFSNRRNKKLKDVRKRVGVVFQFPEYQLFEETVLKDIMFGPLNFGAKKEEAKEKALWAAKTVGISDKILQKSPFQLSGGQMRKVAIAGILAMEPDILVLDEPTRGLDPQAKEKTMELFLNIWKQGVSVVMITHDMDLVAKYAKRVIVMCDGKKVYDGTKEALFKDKDFDSFHLELPSSIQMIDYLNKVLGRKMSRDVFTLEDVVLELKKNG